MATKTQKRKTTTKVNLKNQYGKIHDQVLDVTEEAVEITVENIEKWQKLIRKTIKNSSPIVEKNIDLTLEVAETLAKQYKTGTSRFKNLIGWDDKAIKKAVSDNVKTAKRVAKKIETTTTEAIESITATKTVTAKTVKTVQTPTAKTVATKTVKTPTTKAEKTPAVKAAKINVTNLKIVSGIGPKIEKLLNAEGINNMADLATAQLDTLNKVLDAAGPRFKMHNPSTWVTQAKTIIKA